MRTRKWRTGPALLLIAVLVSGLVAPGAAIADTNPPKLPSHLRLVDDPTAQSWAQTPGSQLSGPVQVVLHVDKAPLAAVGKFWTHAQRRAYVQEITALQDALLPQIEALGGQVVGRFIEASAGVGVIIDRTKVTQLRGLQNVIGVRGVGNYELALTETVPWIGATGVQNLGVTGTHDYTGLGLDVAVIDSGIDYTHVKFGGPGTAEAYAQAYCGDPAATPDPTDPACNAHTQAPDSALFGPTHKVAGGYDWVGEAWPGTPADPKPIAPDANPIDYEGHGTHVADIIGGLESAPGVGDQGVAPGVRLWAFKACSAVSSSCNGLALLLAIDDALDLDDSDWGVCDPAEDDDCTTFDPADVINMSLGSPYGQPEDDLTHFANLASYYGSVVVVSAGNSGDKPYIVGSPSAAAGAISVAQSTVPSDKLHKISAGAVVAAGFVQPWGLAIPEPLAGALQYGDGAGGNLNGCEAFAAGSLAGKVLLVDRGACAVSIKGANGSAAGAVLVVVANNQFSNTPPSFSYGGGAVTAPTLSITQTDGNSLKTVLGQTAAAGPDATIMLQDDIVATSARGPRAADGAIKPDIAAPGASISAEVGTGNAKTAFGGTSGASPMVAGAAALMIQNLEQRGFLNDANPGVVRPGISLTPLVKTILMNNANPDTYIGGSLANGGRGFLSPITLQGAGRVDALAAFQSDTFALDVTDLYAWWSADPSEREPPCTVSTPPTNAMTHLVLPEWYNGSYDCLSAYPFANDFFNAWNALSGSVSFGYDGVATQFSETRTLLIANAGQVQQTYTLSAAFRYPDDVAKGVSLTVEPATITVEPRWIGLVDVTLSVAAAGLRDWTIDAGTFGAAGTNTYCDPSDPGSINPRTGCPTLTMFEYDGFITIDGGAENTVRMPWQILPKQTADTAVTAVAGRVLTLTNAGPAKNSRTDAFALVDVSPNNCEIVDNGGNCVETDYEPGILPGINATAIDIKEVGVRGYTVPDISKLAKITAQPFTPLNDDVIDFGITVYDAPFRASHNYPVEFDIYVDSNADGVNDYVVFNADLTQNAADGRNAVFVADINGEDGTKELRPYFFTNSNFNSQNWILPVPAAAIDVSPLAKFKFYALAFDAYFTGSLWDCSPYDCGEYHSYTARWPKYRPGQWFFTVPAASTKPLYYLTPLAGATLSPSQTGLLFLYRDAPVGRESEHILLP